LVLAWVSGRGFDHEQTPRHRQPLAIAITALVVGQEINPRMMQSQKQAHSIVEVPLLSLFMQLLER
jgi:hypothetical protein